MQIHRQVVDHDACNLAVVRRPRLHSDGIVELRVGATAPEHGEPAGVQPDRGGGPRAVVDDVERVAPAVGPAGHRRPPRRQRDRAAPAAARVQQRVRRGHGPAGRHLHDGAVGGLGAVAKTRPERPYACGEHDGGKGHEDPAESGPAQNPRDEPHAGSCDRDVGADHGRQPAGAREAETGVASQRPAQRLAAPESHELAEGVVLVARPGRSGLEHDVPVAGCGAAVGDHDLALTGRARLRALWLPRRRNAGDLHAGRLVDKQAATPVHPAQQRIESRIVETAEVGRGHHDDVEGLQRGPARRQPGRIDRKQHRLAGVDEQGRLLGDAPVGEDRKDADEVDVALVDGAHCRRGHDLVAGHELDRCGIEAPRAPFPGNGELACGAARNLDRPSNRQTRALAADAQLAHEQDVGSHLDEQRKRPAAVADPAVADLHVQIGVSRGRARQPCNCGHYDQTDRCEPRTR